MIGIRAARFPADAAMVRKIFAEYGASLGLDLSFQDFDGELAGLPGKYAAPGGAVLLAFQEGELLGCVAMRPSGASIAEMKRLYVRPSARGLHLGRKLAEAMCDAARAAGYDAIRLDTLPAMRQAQALYAALGFVEVAPYIHNPVPGTRFMERDLTRSNTAGESGLN